MSPLYRGCSASFKPCRFDVQQHRRRVLGEHVQWIAELAERTIESAHDRARICTLLARVRETLNAGPVMDAGEDQ